MEKKSFKKYIGMLSKDEIIKKKLCRSCDLSICNNKYELCQYLKNKGYSGGLDIWLK